MQKTWVYIPEPFKLLAMSLFQKLSELKQQSNSKLNTVVLIHNPFVSDQKIITAVFSYLVTGTNSGNVMSGFLGFFVFASAHLGTVQEPQEQNSLPHQQIKPT